VQGRQGQGTVDCGAGKCVWGTVCRGREAGVQQREERGLHASRGGGRMLATERCCTPGMHPKVLKQAAVMVEEGQGGVWVLVYAWELSTCVLQFACM
jgi:hypothetical protein